MGAVSPLRDDAIRLSDGRRLAFVEWGDPEGVPVFFFHGTPLSRLDCPDEAVAASSGVRVVTVDRPGIGGSEVLPRRTFADWPDDVVQLADSLGVGRFGVVGWSAGGPYAAACAARIPGRLTGVGIGASHHLSRFNIVENPSAYEELGADHRRLFELAKHDPDAAVRASVRAKAASVRSLGERPEALLEALPVSDLQYVEQDPERRRAFLEAVRESVRQGPEAFAWEEIAVFQPWGFRLTDITIEVHVFYGELDVWVERRHIDFIANTLPHARLTVWSDTGHGVGHHWNEVLQAVTPN